MLKGRSDAKCRERVRVLANANARRTLSTTWGEREVG